MAVSTAAAKCQRPHVKKDTSLRSDYGRLGGRVTGDPSLLPSSCTPSATLNNRADLELRQLLPGEFSYQDGREPLAITFGLDEVLVAAGKVIGLYHLPSVPSDDSIRSQSPTPSTTFLSPTSSYLTECSPETLLELKELGERKVAAREGRLLD